MREYLSKLPKEIQDLIHFAGVVANRSNMRVYLVGGCVRDLLLGVKNLDLDIVVEGNGIKFAEEMANTLNTKLIRHKRFGTATLILLKHRLKIDPSTSLRVNGERPSTSLRTALSEQSESNGRSRTIDIATARKEFYPQAGHLPVVESGTLRDDIFRRDFTINCLAIDINKDSFGHLIDLFGAREDLKNKKIRVLHDLSFIDDPTRILRAVRFEQRYNFKIEPQTLKLLKDAVRKRMLEKVEPQRIRNEFILILKEKDPLKEIKRLKELVGFNFITSRTLVSLTTYKFIKSVEKQISWFNKTYSQRRLLDTWLMYFMAFMNSLSVTVTRQVCQKFVFRKGEDKRILCYKKLSTKFISDLKKAKNRPSKIFSLLEPLSYEAILLIKAKYKNRDIQRIIEDFFEIYNGMKIYSSGHDLRSLGLAPGPYYQKIFTKVLNAKLNGLVKTKEEELELIKELILNK